MVPLNLSCCSSAAYIARQYQACAFMVMDALTVSSGISGQNRVFMSLDAVNRHASARPPVTRGGVVKAPVVAGRRTDTPTCYGSQCLAGKRVGQLPLWKSRRIGGEIVHGRTAYIVYGPRMKGKPGSVLVQQVHDVVSGVEPGL
jgi:hypothetical protein